MTALKYCDKQTRNLVERALHLYGVPEGYESIAMAYIEGIKDSVKIFDDGTAKHLTKNKVSSEIRNYWGLKKWINYIKL